MKLSRYIYLSTVVAIAIDVKPARKWNTM